MAGLCEGVERGLGGICKAGTVAGIDLRLTGAGGVRGRISVLDSSSCFISKISFLQ